jgi:uncharacterized protein YggU (UPF0235/DUF167 family)
MLPWRETPDGIELAVRLTPRGGAPRIEGVVDVDGQPFLQLRVPAPPVDGAANLALVYYLAKALRIPRSAITLVVGERARLKRLRLRGDGVGRRLAALVPAPQTPR